MDSKAIAELIEQRRAEERERRLAALKADGIGGAAVDGAGGPGIPAYSSSDPAIDVLAHGIESRLDMDPHTAKAENARLSLALASFGGLPPNVSSEALFMDRDSDDELDDEDDDDAATIDGTPRSKKRSTSSLTGRRAGLNGGAAPLDSDEEIETTKKKDKINALLARAKVMSFLVFSSRLIDLIYLSNNVFRKAKPKNLKARPSTSLHCNPRLRTGTWYELINSHG
jgi:hypothetical protein